MLFRYAPVECHFVVIIATAATRNAATFRPPSFFTSIIHITVFLHFIMLNPWLNLYRWAPPLSIVYVWCIMGVRDVLLLVIIFHCLLVPHTAVKPFCWIAFKALRDPLSSLIFLLPYCTIHFISELFVPAEISSWVNGNYGIDDGTCAISSSSLSSSLSSQFTPWSKISNLWFTHTYLCKQELT